MDILSIYAQPDIDSPLKAFEGLMRSFKQYGFRECDNLTLIIPAGGPEFVAKMQGMVGLLGEGHKVVPVAYPSLRARNITLPQYHNNIMCRVFEEYKGMEGKFLYIPFGCEPNEKNWMKTIETVVNMHSDKLFIGDTRVNADGFDYLSGACILDGAWMRKTSMWQQMKAREYPFNRGARPMQGGLKSYPFPFNDLDMGGDKLVMSYMTKGALTKPERVAEEHASDVPDSTSEKIEEKVDEFVAPVVVEAPVVVPDPLEEVKAVFKETKEAPDGVSDLLEKAKAESKAQKDELDAKNREAEGKPPLRRLAKKAGKKGAKKKGAKKKTAAKKASKKTASEKPQGFGINAGASGEDRVDHSV